MFLENNNEAIITRSIAATNAFLKLEVEGLRKQIKGVTEAATVFQYKLEVFDPHFKYDESLVVVITRTFR